MIHNFQLQPVQIIQCIFIFQMFMATLLIWHLNRYRNLAWFFIFQAILSAFNVLEGLDITKQYYLVTPVFTLIFGPVFYFFIRSLVKSPPMNRFSKWQHFILPCLALPFTKYTQLVIACGSMSQIVYFYLSFNLLTRYHNASKAMRSDADSFKLSWIIVSFSVFIIVTVLDLLRMNVQTFTPTEINVIWYFISEVIFLSISCYLLIKVIKQPQLFDELTSYEQMTEHQTQNDDIAEYDLAQKVFSVIEAKITEQQLFKKPRLSVTDLSGITGFKVKDISWAINTITQRNFCEYINELRVNSVKKEIVEGHIKNRSILTIALDSGFNSKSTFNAVFKKELGLTPSQFQKQYLNEKMI